MRKLEELKKTAIDEIDEEKAEIRRKKEEVIKDKIKSKNKENERLQNEIDLKKKRIEDNRKEIDQLTEENIENVELTGYTSSTTCCVSINTKGLWTSIGS